MYLNDNPKKNKINNNKNKNINLTNDFIINGNNNQFKNNDTNNNINISTNRTQNSLYKSKNPQNKSYQLPSTQYRSINTQTNQSSTIPTVSSLNYTYTQSNFNLNYKGVNSEKFKETFCYCKIIKPNEKKFNPLKYYTINPENLGYFSGYISINFVDEILNFDSNNKDSNKFYIKLNKINAINITENMKKILKIHSTFIKYGKKCIKDNIGNNEKKIVSIN
jgi:hypothetical protein